MAVDQPYGIAGPCAATTARRSEEHAIVRFHKKDSYCLLQVCPSSTRVGFEGKRELTPPFGLQ